MINRHLKIFTYFTFVNGLNILEVNPPKPTNHALVARQVIHNCAWVALSTISTMPAIKSYPYTSLQSIVDGFDEKGNGVPYFYVASLDPAMIDIQTDNHCSVMASMAEIDWCTTYDMDPEDPRCQRVVLSGNFVLVNNATEEHDMALDHMLKKHPQVKDWPKAHEFDIAKMEIKQITLFDWFGGIQTIALDDYFKAND